MKAQTKIVLRYMLKSKINKHIAIRELDVHNVSSRVSEIIKSGIPVIKERHYYRTPTGRETFYFEYRLNSAAKKAANKLLRSGT